LITQAVILCGGKGERLGDALRFCPTIDIPKPLIEVGGKPFVTYSINWLKAIGIKNIILSVLHESEQFNFLANDNVVKLVESSSKGPDKSIIESISTSSKFILLNGDCYPVMDWRAFSKVNVPVVTTKPCGRDAGCAIVSVNDIVDGVVSCSSISGMRDIYHDYMVEGGLHIGTPQGLQRARMYMDIVVYGQ